MKKRLSALIALILVILLITIGTAQAASKIKSNISGSIINIPINPTRTWTTTDIYTEWNAGEYVSLAFDPDHAQVPWISYFNASVGGLYVAHFVGAPDGNCGPQLTWLCELVDWSFGDTKGTYTSIDIFPDIDSSPIFSTWKVGVSYYDASHNALKYAVYRCPLSGCAWTISTIDSSTADGDIVGQYTSLKFNSQGVPHIAYYQRTAGIPFSTYSVRHAAPVDPGTGNCGDTDWHCGAVDSSIIQVGLYPSLDIDWSDNVYIAYYDSLTTSLKYAYYGGIGDCGESNGWICQVIDDPAGVDVGLFPSLHAPMDASDFLRVAYYDATNGTLKYAYSNAKELGNCGPGNGWWCSTIDTMGAGLTWASVSLDVDPNYKPIIAYTDASEDLAPLGLKVAEPAYGQPYANCAGEILFDWYCQSVDNGGAYVDAGKFASLGIKDNGLAMIAYSALNTYDYPATYDLRLALQVTKTFLPLNLKLNMK